MKQTLYDNIWRCSFSTLIIFSALAALSCCVVQWSKLYARFPRSVLFLIRLFIYACGIYRLYTAQSISTSALFFYLAAIDSFLNTHRPGSYFTTPHVGLHISSAALICYRVYIRLSLSLASIYFFPFGRDWLTDWVRWASVCVHKTREGSAKCFSLNYCVQKMDCKLNNSNGWHNEWITDNVRCCKKESKLTFFDPEWGLATSWLILLLLLKQETTIKII